MVRLSSKNRTGEPMPHNGWVPEGASRLAGSGKGATDEFWSIIMDRSGERARPHRFIVLVVDLLLVCCGIALVVAIAWFPARWAMHAYDERRTMDAANIRVAKWPQERILDEYQRAQDYNRRIASSDQAALGEYADPFDALQGGAKPRDQKDGEYQSLLNDGYGVMGVVHIPRISVKMPIYHGTSDEALLHGAGHLYGTSLPVGGESTNAVLSGHRGLSDALLFTRLDELKKGDIFYVETLNHTMGYRVVGVHVIDPGDTRFYKVMPGQDMVTLMTCTPYGVNTQRLVVTGVRQNIPDPIPEPGRARGDSLLVGLLTSAVVLVVGFIAVAFGHRRGCTVRPPVRHRKV